MSQHSEDDETRDKTGQTVHQTGYYGIPATQQIEKRKEIFDHVSDSREFVCIAQKHKNGYY